MDLTLHQGLENVLWAYKCGGKIIVNFPPLDMGNGQKLQVNQVLKQHLQCTINYYQNNWSSLSPTIEFMDNNNVNLSTSQKNLFANHGLHLKFGIVQCVNVWNEKDC